MKRSLIQCSGREMHSGSTALLDVKNQRIIKMFLFLLDIIMQLSVGLKRGSREGAFLGLVHVHCSSLSVYLVTFERFINIISHPIPGSPQSAKATPLAATSHIGIP